MKVRYTRSELAIVSNNSKMAGYTKARWIRERSLKSVIKPKKFIYQEHKQLLKDISGVANNINQLTKKAHIGYLNQQLISENLIKISQLIDKLL